MSVYDSLFLKIRNEEKREKGMERREGCYRLNKMREDREIESMDLCALCVCFVFGKVVLRLTVFSY